MNDKVYWSNYYLENNKPTEPSTFAKFVIDKLDKNKTLIELGAEMEEIVCFSLNRD